MPACWLQSFMLVNWPHELTTCGYCNTIDHGNTLVGNTSTLVVQCCHAFNAVSRELMNRVVTSRAIPWWRLWPKFENFSLLIDHSSYNKQAINHFVVDVRSTLGGQSTATPKKINLGQGQAQCPCNARWRLWLRTKVGSASELLQSPISVKCDRVLCQHLYIWWTTYC